ncbi:MAG: response regulator [Acidobacteriota bacterium]
MIVDADLQTVLEPMIDGVIIATDTGKIEWVNSAAARIFGYGRDELIGRYFKRLLAVPEGDEEAFLRSVPAKALGDVTQWEGRRKDGQRFPIEVALSSFRTASGLHFMGSVRDVSERQEIDRMKNEFISVVSHELRTPLTSIRGSLQIVLDEQPQFADEEHEPLLKIALNNCERLIRIINDILDVSKIEAGQMDFDRRDCAVTDIVEAAVESVRPMALAAGVELAVELPGPDPGVHGDFDRLVQVLVNLLSNAVKYSPAGTTVTTSARQVDGHVDFAVADRGRGIKEEHFEQLFRKFHQVDSSPRRRAGGTGLGLAMVKAIVEQHAGRVSVKSRLGEGSTFTVRLPAAHGGRPSSIKGAPLPPPAPARGRTVMVVDDDADVRRVMRRQLEQVGYHVIEVADGGHAVAMAIAEKPDLITMDLLMPGLGGLAATRALASDVRTRDIPVVIVSALAEVVRVGNTAAAVAKPARPDHLLSEIGRVLRRKAGRPTILLAEDDDDLRDVLAKALRDRGYHVVTAADGLEACQRFDETMCDLVLLDLHMPRRDGFEVIAHVRGSDRKPPVPIAVISGSVGGEGQGRSVELGANLFMSKPVDAAQLVREIASLLD